MQMKSSTKLIFERLNVYSYVRRSKQALLDISQQRNNANNYLQARLLQGLEIPFKCSAMLVGVGKGEDRLMEEVER